MNGAGAQGLGPAFAAVLNTQFGWPWTTSNRMLGPINVSFLISIRRNSRAGKDSSARIISARAMSGRVPPGRLASFTSLTSIVGHRERLMRNGPSKVSGRPVASSTALAISGL